MFRYRIFHFALFSFLALACVAGCAEGAGGGDTPLDASPDGKADTGVPDTSVPDTSVPDGDMPDTAIPDTAVPDTAIPDTAVPDTAQAECATAPDCDDGDACNGAETCVNEKCVAGTPMVCNDGVTCTTDSCIDGMCVHPADDALCPAGHSCNPMTGCEDTSCAESPCKLVSPQCGCEGGQACYTGPAGHFCETPSAGARPSGSECTVQPDCTAGNICIRLESGTKAICRNACNNDAMCPGNAVCINAINATDIGCSQDCEPATGSGCIADARCDIFVRNSDRRVFTECVGGIGAGRDGASCNSDSDCYRDHVCVDTDVFGVGFGKRCLKYCRDWMGNIDCPVGSCSTSLLEISLPAGTYGVCNPLSI